MAATHPCIATAGVDPANGELVILADGRAVLRLTPEQGVWLIARAAQALATAKSLSTAAVRSGCASDGEVAPPASPDLT